MLELWIPGKKVLEATQNVEVTTAEMKDLMRFVIKDPWGRLFQFSELILVRS